MSSLRLHIGMFEDFVLEEKKNHFLTFYFAKVGTSFLQGIVFHYMFIFVK